MEFAIAAENLRIVCDQCRAAGLKSTVRITAAKTLAAGEFEAFWDEDGRQHRHDPNSTSRMLHCSNGHTWEFTAPRPPCPVVDCEWNNAMTVPPRT